MDTDNKPIINQEIVIKGQRIASIAAFVLFILADSISVKVFGVEKYGVLGICIPMFYLGASSIKNRVSIVRLKGQKGYSRDTRACCFRHNHGCYCIRLHLYSFYSVSLREVISFLIG